MGNTSSPYLPPIGVWENATVNLTLASKTGLYRVFLLAKYGGIWADASCLCLGPILPYYDLMLRLPLGFYMPRAEPDRQVASWFMMSKRRSPLFLRVLRASL